MKIAATSIPPEVVSQLLSLQRADAEPLAAFVYDLPALRRHVAGLRADLPGGAELFYAIKANSMLPILESVGGCLHGFEVASGGELALVQRHFPRSPVLFGGPGKTPAELQAALQAGVEALHVESLWELRQLAELKLPARLLLRVNPVLQHAEDSPMLMAGKPSPFGLQPDDLGEAARLLREAPHLECQGFHLHTRSLQLSVDDHLGLLGGYFALCRRWETEHDLPLKQVNVGGGIGVNYRQPDQQFNWTDFCRRLELPPGVLVRFECGRFVSGFCGYYAVEVLDLKPNHGENFAVCRGGTHHFRLPAAQNHSHPFCVLPGRERPGAPEMRNVELNVVGQLCTPKDRLATGAHVDRVRVGDLLVFPLAGAYAWNISHHEFLMHPPPLQLFL